MRKIYFTLLFVLASSVAHSQFYKSLLPSPEFTSAIEKIVLDFRLNYNSIKGDSIMKEGGMESFESAVKLPGATDCSILYYSSRIDTTASWQATMYKGNNFREAARVYENVYRLVKKSHIRWIDRSSISFSGDLHPAKEEVGFASTLLTLSLDDPRYDRFKAEVELLTISYDNYEVHLNLHARKADNEKY